MIGLGECSVCVERLTASRRAQCVYCEYLSCKSCVQRYLLGTPDDANCMSCRRSFDRGVLIALTSRAFVDGEYKRHRERCLFDRETAMMPATMPYVDQERQRRRNEQLLQSLRRERTELKRKLAELDRDIDSVQSQMLPPLDEERDRREFVHKCPRPDCRGFLSTSWKCHACEWYICSECNEPKGRERLAEHACVPEDREALQLIRRDSKRCPGCGLYITRVSGCSQMWCTGCHTAFDWRTGAKINGRIHNPHFIEFQRRRETQPGHDLADVPCGGMPSTVELRDALRGRGTAAERECAFQLYRVALHVEQVELERYRVVDGDESNRTLRVRYMLGELSDQDYRRALQKHEKARAKKRSIAMVLHMLVHATSDMLWQLVLATDMAAVRDMIRIVDYANEALEGVAREYFCVVPFVCKTTWTVVTRHARAL